MENKAGSSVDEILDNPLNQVRYWAAGKFGKREFTPELFDELVGKIRPLATDSTSFEEELDKVREAMSTGKTSKTPALKSPYNQMLWGAALATIDNTPNLRQNWEKNLVGKNINEPLTKLPLWDQIAHCPDARTELRENAFIIATAIKNPGTKIRWGMPDQGYPDVSYYYNSQDKMINLDMVWSLMIGVENARAANMHEIGHSQGTIYQPKGSDEAYKKVQECREVMRKLNELPKDEQKVAEHNMLMAMTDYKMRYYIFDEAENNYANRYAVNQSQRSAQDFGTAVNTVETTLCLGLSGGLPEKKENPEIMDLFMNVKNLMRYSFYVNNGLMEDEPNGWERLGVRKEWLVGVDKEGKPMTADQCFNEIRHMCTQLEEAQPQARDRLMGASFYAKKMEDCSHKRCDIIDEMYDRFVSPLIPEIVRQREEQMNKKKEEQERQQEENQKNSQNGQNGNGQQGQNGDQKQQNSDQQQGQQSQMGQQGQQGQEGQGEDGQDQQNQAQQSPSMQMGNGGAGDQPKNDNQQQPQQSQSGKSTSQQSSNGERTGEQSNSSQDIDQQMQQMENQMSNSIKDLRQKQEDKADGKDEQNGQEGKEGQEGQNGEKGQDGKEGDNQDNNPDKGESIEDLVNKENNENNTKSAENDKNTKGQSSQARKGDEEWNPSGNSDKEGEQHSLKDFIPSELRSLNEYTQIIKDHQQTARKVKVALKQMQNMYMGEPKDSNKRELVPEDGDLDKFDIGSYVDRKVKLATGQQVDERDFEHFKVKGEPEKKPAPIDIAILIDHSGSMGTGKDSPFETALATACVMYEAAKDNPCFNVYVVGAGDPYCYPIAEPGQNSKDIAKRIASLRDKCGGSADMMSDGIEKTMEKIKNNKKDEYAGATHFFIISDGDFNDQNKSVPMIDTLCEKSKGEITFNLVLTKKGRNKIEDLADERSKGKGSQRIDRVHISGPKDIDTALNMMLNRRMKEMGKVDAQKTSKKSKDFNSLLTTIQAQRGNSWF
ncbi:MAG: hypothetical protein MJ247_01170 [Alphaproteobacteria bacterium]|nr:hypothetical protein [Alphaproteobacteria bacterium]